MPTIPPTSPNRCRKDRYNPLSAIRNVSRSSFFLRLFVVFVVLSTIIFTYTLFHPFVTITQTRMPLPTPDFASGYLSISWLNILLYTLEITLATYYFSHFKTERVLQLLLCSIILLDTICIVTVLASSWMLLIKSFETYSVGEMQWTVPLSTSMLTAVGVVEELFLMNRCRRLFQSAIILALLLAMVFAHAIFELYSGAYVVAFPGADPNARRYGSKTTAILASLASTVDFLIPVALIIQIHMVTPLQISRQRSWRDTIVNAISSGGLGGIMNVVLVVLFWTRADIFYVLVNTMGRVYVITVFVNLIVSRRRSSPYDVPNVPKRKTLSFTANIKLYNFTKTNVPGTQVLDKQLPPTPNEGRFKRYIDIEADLPSPSLASRISTG